MSDIINFNKKETFTNTYTILAGGGEMGKLIATMDWSKTRLGPIESWPQSLLTTVSLCLASNFPISLAWGSGHVQIYNDGYRPICGAHHPYSMGQDFRECWASSWPEIGQAYEHAWAGGSSFIENMRTIVTRNGYLEEAFFTFSFSPIRDETGEVGGVFHPVTEKTTEMLSERRTRALRDLAAHTAEAKTIEEVFTLAAETLSQYELDVPFSLFYRLDQKATHAHLAASSGLVLGMAASQEKVNIENFEFWPFAQVLRSGQLMQVNNLERTFGELSVGPYPESPKIALVLPISTPNSVHPCAILIAGVSPRLALNDVYRDFYTMLAANMNAAVTRAQAYEQERMRAETLAQLDRAKTAFFSNVSHEFRTPLTLLLGPIEEILAKNDPVIPAENKELLLMAHHNALRLQKLVNTLLDFSRIEAGRIQACFRPTDLASLTADLASNFKSLLERAGLKLIVACAPLPEPMYIDRDLWEKIVLNLISNAFKHTFVGHIKVATRWLHDRAELIVEDTGIGIAPEELPHIFERFHRVANVRSRTHEGSGIGLALVNELVKLHGGTIQVESTVNKGTTFILSIPTGKAHLPADRINAENTLISTALGAKAFVEEANGWLPDRDKEVHDILSDPHQSILEEEAWQGTSPGDYSKARILLADDNMDMRNYVRRLLEVHCQVVAVSNGKAALVAAHEQTPDLILSDVMMPEMDGFELLGALRADPMLKSTPVILLSARAGEEAKVEGLQAGADDYLTKPFHARELLARVKTHLELARIRREASYALQKSLQREKLITAIVESIRSETDLHAVLQKTVDTLGPFTQADRCTIWLYDADQKQYHIPNNEYRSSMDVVCIADTSYPYNPVLPFNLSHQELIHLPDILAYEGLTEVDKQMIQERGIKSLLHVPICYENKLLGLLRIHTYWEKREWSTELIAIVEQIAGHIAIAIHKAALLKELKESEALKTAILESSLDAIVNMDHQGRIIAWNSAAERLFGYSRTEAIGRNMADLIIPERYREAHYKGLAKYVTTSQGRVIGKLLEVPALRADGGEFLSELTISPISVEGPPLFTGTLRDITQRKQAEEALAESEERFRTFANNIQNLAWMANPDGWIFWYNQRWYDYTGTTLEEMQGWGWKHVHHPDHIERVMDFVKDAWSKAETWELTFPLRSADGEYRWFLTRAYAVKNAEGKVVRWIGTNTDIEEQKRAEKELQKKNEELMRINSDLDNFIYTASHDLKAPITNIEGLVDMLVRSISKEVAAMPRVDKTIEMIKTSIARFKNIIHDLTELTKLQRSTEEAESLIDLSQLLEEIQLDLATSIQSTGAKLEVDFSQCPSIPFSKKNLRSVMYNLVSNAIKYHSPDRIPLVHVSTKAEQGFCVLIVEDNGLGMDLSQESKIFSMFKRLHSHVEGSGIGLYIVKKIVEDSGGKITVESELGKGSTFKVYLNY